jgi:hypothetical protein
MCAPPAADSLDDQLAALTLVNAGTLVWWLQMVIS